MHRPILMIAEKKFRRLALWNCWSRFANGQRFDGFEEKHPEAPRSLIDLVYAPQEVDSLLLSILNRNVLAIVSALVLD
jgi:hypothetical protein